MKLKEIDLDLPYVVDSEILCKGEKISDSEIRNDYETNWKQKRRNFRLETRCVSAMFERLLGGMVTDNCWKVLVECVENIESTDIRDFSGVYTVQVKFSYDEFVVSNEKEKKMLTLSAIMNGLKLISESEGWNYQIFEEVRLSMLKKNLYNEWLWGNPIANADKNLIAKVLINHEVEFVDISIIIFNKNGEEISKKKIISEIPDEFAYAKHLGKLIWISNNEVALVNCKEDKQVIYKF